MLPKTCKIGATSEAMVCGYLAGMGYEIYSPRQDHGRADLVYLSDSSLVRVQVKTASLSDGSSSAYRYESCRLVRANGKNTPYTKDEIDEVWVVGTHLWCFPVEVLEGLTSITLLSTNPSPRKTVRGYDPNSFIVVDGSFDKPFRDRLFFNEPNPPRLVTNNSHSPETIRAMQYKPGGAKYRER